MTDAEMITYALIGMALFLIVGFILFGRHTRGKAESKAVVKVREYVLEHVFPTIKDTLLAKKDSLEIDIAEWWDDGSTSDRMMEFKNSVCLQGDALCIEDVVVKASDLIAVEVKESDGKPRIVDGKLFGNWFKSSNYTLRGNHWSFEVDGVGYISPYTNPILTLPDPVEFTFIVSGQMMGDRRYIATCDVRDYCEIREYVDGLASKAFG